MVTVSWIGGRAFEATPPSGVPIILDSHPEFGGEGKGPTPIEALLSSVAACSAIDVLAILEKKKQQIDAYRIEIDGERVPEGQYPRPFLTMTIRHVVTGPNIDPLAVERAVQLSDEKYCSVIATLRTAPKISSEYRIESPSPV